MLASSDHLESCSEGSKPAVLDSSGLNHLACVVLRIRNDLVVETFCHCPKHLKNSLKSQRKNCFFCNSPTPRLLFRGVGSVDQQRSVRNNETPRQLPQICLWFFTHLIWFITSRKSLESYHLVMTLPVGHGKIHHFIHF